MNPKYLGTRRAMGERELDTIPSFAVSEIRFTTDELTSRCPVTRHPDFNRLIIAYCPDELSIESKSLKLYIERWRDEGVFCEELATVIAADVMQAINPHWVEVRIEQRVRGGLQLTAISRRKGKYENHCNS